jgi:hypothetical protein
MSQPDWSDHDVSDPGITLLELFSFLGEQLDFRNPERRPRALLLLTLAAAVGLLWWLRSDD